jgi:hypothetical protein
MTSASLIPVWTALRKLASLTRGRSASRAGRYGLSAKRIGAPRSLRWCSRASRISGAESWISSTASA